MCMWFDTFTSGAPVWYAECWKPRPGAGQSTCGRITEATWVLSWRHPNQTQQGCSSSATSSFFFFKITVQLYKHQSSSRISSVQSLSCVRLFVTSWTAARQASLSITSSCSLLKSCPKSQWWHTTISSSVVPFSFHLQSFPASGSFQMSQFFYQVAKVL